MNQNVSGNRKLFWNEVNKVNGGKGGELQWNKRWRGEAGTGRG